MRNYSSPRIIQLSILVAACDPALPVAGARCWLCAWNSTRARGRRNGKGGAPQAFLCELCAPPATSW